MVKQLYAGRYRAAGSGTRSLSAASLNALRVRRVERTFSGKVAPTRIQLGDAALAIDPISSSGVQKAIQTALSGAIVANTLLRRPELTDAALSFYRTQLSDASERHR